MSMTPDSFHSLARKIAALNDLPLDIAEAIAAEVGDCIIMNDDGDTITLTLPDETEPRTILWPTDL